MCRRGPMAFPRIWSARQTVFPNKVVFDRGEHYDYFYPMLDPGLVADNDIGRNHADCDETPSTLWSHDHLLDFTAANVYRGLAGFYLAFGRAS